MGSTWWGILLTRCGLLVENNTFYRTAEERRQQRCWRYLIMHSLPLFYTNPIPPLLILFACLPIRSGLFGAADIERDLTSGVRETRRWEILTLQANGLVQLDEIRGAFAESLHGAETALYRIRTIHIVLAFTS